eukprot:855931-Ditylum_brightwellii.AAC.1
MVFKYDIEVPWSAKYAIELDEKNGDMIWQVVMALETKALNEMECLKFQNKDNIPRGGHYINVLYHGIYLSTVKGISVKLPHVIAHANKLEPLCGNISNVFINAYTTKKMYARAGLDFGKELCGKTVVMKKALYGLATSC